MLILCAFLPVAIWTYVLAGRGAFWRISKRTLPQPHQTSQLSGTKRIVVIIPARDEAEHIGDTVSSLLKQTHLPSRIILVDDGSTDGTSGRALDAAESTAFSNRLSVVSGKPLPPGWTGKLWALEQGVLTARSEDPDFLLFTDADITHSPDSLASLLMVAEQGSFDLVSVMVLLSCRTRAEQALIPAFAFFFFLLYPPAWISSKRLGTAGAAGGCILISPHSLQIAGGLGQIRSAVIDDCALARLVKRSGGRLWLGLSASTSSTRVYATFSEVSQMISRTAFYQLHHSSLLLGATVLGLTVTYVGPVALLLTFRVVPVACGLISFALMGTCYGPFLRLYRRPSLQIFTLPFVAAFYGGATLLSAVRYWRGRGGSWKGRLQDTR